MKHPIDDIIYWASFIAYYASPALAFGLAAMAWQRFQHRAFLLLGLASMLTVLQLAMNAVEGRQRLTEDERWIFWRCRNALVVADAILYPWSLISLFRLYQGRCCRPDTKSDEQKDGPC
jgi:hypothetical protein